MMSETQPQVINEISEELFDRVYRQSLVSLGILPTSHRKSIRSSSTKKSIWDFDSETIQYGPNGQVIITRLKQPDYSIRLYVDVKVCRPLGWNLPSNGAPYDLCGHIYWAEGKGCLEVHNHPGSTVYIRRVALTCFRAECPVCYQKWASREARRIEDKFKRLSRNNAEASVPGLGKPIHAVVCVPESDAYLMHDDFPLLRAKAYVIATRAGIVGGGAIFHPYANEDMHEETPEKILIDKSTGDFALDSLRAYYAKMDKHINFWYVRPHFHIIGYAPRDWDNPDNDPFTDEKVSSIYADTGWVVKNLGVRDSVRNTAHYQLSHCGVKKGVQTVTWFGLLSNRKYCELDPLPKRARAKPTCPECQAELQPVRWDPLAEVQIQTFNIDTFTELKVLDFEYVPPPLPPPGLPPEGGYWFDLGSWRYLNKGEKNHSCFIRRPDSR
ncbi:hypothetical protein ES703_79217 [subsurface metagenome]